MRIIRAVDGTAFIMCKNEWCRNGMQIQEAEAKAFESVAASIAEPMWTCHECQIAELREYAAARKPEAKA